jgi:hypothetical protein
LLELPHPNQAELSFYSFDRNFVSARACADRSRIVWKGRGAGSVPGKNVLSQGQAGRPTPKRSDMGVTRCRVAQNSWPGFGSLYRNPGSRNDVAHNFWSVLHRNPRMNWLATGLRDSSIGPFCQHFDQPSSPRPRIKTKMGFRYEARTAPSRFEISTRLPGDREPNDPRPGARRCTARGLVPTHPATQRASATQEGSRSFLI